MTHAKRSSAACGFAENLWLPKGWEELNFAVALSGGADSVALLRGLLDRKRTSGGPGGLFALHVDHQLRGENSTEDARWCQRLCASLDVPLQVLRCDTVQLAEVVGDGIEAAARQARYELLTSAAEQQGARYLATAHTRDDLVETILFRIVRGTGLRGLAGIPQFRKLTPSLSLVRPVLGCSRANLLQYLAELQQDYRTDESNQDPQFVRNRLRHELLPQLREQYNSSVDEALLRLASQAGEAQQMVEQLAGELLKQATRPSPAEGQLLLTCEPFTSQPPWVVAEALRLAWREIGLAEQAMTHDWWSKLSQLVLAAQQGEVLNLPGGVRASVSRGQLRISW